jgi:hypothetical protein
MNFFLSAERCVYAVWGLLTLALFGFVYHYGRNMPMWEEWYDLPALFGEAPLQEWLTGRLNEHRYILGRTLFYGLFHATGQNFTSGMYVNVVMLSASALVLIRAMKSLRGQSSCVDVVIPLLLMNPAGYENLILSYQMHFTIDVFLISCLMSCIAIHDINRPHITAWRVSILSGLLALGGWAGLAFVPGATLWVAYLALQRRNWRDGFALVIPLLACGFFAWCYRELQQNPMPEKFNNDLPTTLRVSGEFLSMGFGNLGIKHWPATGIVAALGSTVLGCWLLSLLFKSQTRSVALGGLTILSAIALMTYATGSARPVGFAVRNVPLVAMLPILALVLQVKTGWPHLKGQYGKVIVIAVAIWVHAYGWRDGMRMAKYLRTKNDMFQRDLQEGLPFHFLVSRHQLFPCSEFANGLRLMQRHDHVITRNMLPSGPLSFVPLTREADGSYRVPEAVSFGGVRVQFRFFQPSERTPIRIIWQNPDGESICQPWLTPNIWTLDFPVPSSVKQFRIEPLNPSDRLEILQVEAINP